MLLLIMERGGVVDFSKGLIIVCLKRESPNGKHIIETNPNNHVPPDYFPPTIKHRLPPLCSSEERMYYSRKNDLCGVTVSISDLCFSVILHTCFLSDSGMQLSLQS